MIDSLPLNNHCNAASIRHRYEPEEMIVALTYPIRRSTAEFEALKTPF
jgi:hypothetical protein